MARSLTRAEKDERYLDELVRRAGRPPSRPRQRTPTAEISIAGQCPAGHAKEEVIAEWGEECQWDEWYYDCPRCGALISDKENAEGDDVTPGMRRCPVCHGTVRLVLRDLPSD